MNAPTPKMTAARRDWLELLRDEGPQPRGRSRVGFDCHRLGWTDWAYTLNEPGYPPITMTEAQARFGEKWFDHVLLAGEHITPAGLLALESDDEHQ